MTSDKVNQLRIEIQRLRTKMIEAYTDLDTPYEDALLLSQELDILIVEYHRLLTELNKKHQENENQG